MSLLRRAVHSSKLSVVFVDAVIYRRAPRGTPFARIPSGSRWKSKLAAKSTSEFIPTSKQPISDEAARQEYDRASEKMNSALEWFKRECTGLELRASGRVTPAILDSVRVSTAHGSQRLNEVATVGVKDGSMLLVTAFEEKNVKKIEEAIYDAKLPSITPQRHDARTIRIPIPKVTVEARIGLYAVAHRQAEETRMQIRRHHQASLKRGKYEKHSVELEEFQKLENRFVAEVDKILLQVKKTTGAK